MFRKLAKSLGYTMTILCTASALAFAGVQGTVVAVDDDNLATVQTVSGQTIHVELAGVQVGDKVDCTMHDGKATCKKVY